MPYALSGKTSRLRLAGARRICRTKNPCTNNHIQRVLDASGGNKTHAAKALGIDYKTLLTKLKKYGLAT